eukprot:COSAG05_NODE_12684_length_458_cov_2.662953_1_plen_58_part_01
MQQFTTEHGAGGADQLSGRRTGQRAVPVLKYYREQNSCVPFKRGTRTLDIYGSCTGIP